MVLDSRSGKNALAARVAMLFQNIAEQFDFQVVPGREIRVSTFAGERMMPEAVPIKTRHAQAGPRRDHCAISFRVLRACAQRHQIL